MFKDQGLAQCEDYTQSGHFKNAGTGVEYPTSVKLNRGFRPGRKLVESTVDLELMVEAVAVVVRRWFWW